MTPIRLVTLSLALLVPDAVAQDGGPPRGPRNTTLEVVERFDADGNGRLDRAERAAAKPWVAENRPPSRFGRGRGRDRGPENTTPPVGQQIDKGAVETYGDHPMFDPDIVRTVFLDFSVADTTELDPDWHTELTAFYRTDVQVPATVTIDGNVCRDVGVRFRGNTSFMMVRGKKKSFDLEFDFVHPGQNVGGVRNLDLLNCNGDASYMREALHGWLSNHYLPAPRVALVRVVCNGEDFGTYAAVQQFDRDFLRDHYGTKGGDRFKVPPDFSGDGGLRYLGDDPAAYERNYQLKSGANPQAWIGLIDLCAVLENTATEDLERVLTQHLDVDAALWFLAVDNAVADGDGYHSRASDYALYRDPKGRFHPVARDNNEILGTPRGNRGGPPRPGPGRGDPGRRGRRGGDTSKPLAMADRDDRPLLSRMLEVPTWRQRYLANVREIALHAFDPQIVGQRVGRWRELLAPIVERDAHSPTDYRDFEDAVAVDAAGKPAEDSLLAIVAKRRATILADPVLAGDWPVVSDVATTFAHGPDGRPALHVRCRAGEASIAAVRLHHDRGRFGAYDTTLMADDGRHGDGEAGDGVYGGWLPPTAESDTWRFWVEAVARDSGHVDCVPPGGGAKPHRWVAPSKIF